MAGFCFPQLRNSSFMIYYKNMKKGFTLVELMIVIVIVGILASIIIANMTSSRNRAKDSSIQQSLRELRNAGELYFNEAGTYDGICAEDNTISDAGNFGRIEDYINSNGGDEIKCLDSDSAYAVIASLNVGDCWCVDNQGSSKEVILGSGETCSDKLLITRCP